MKLFDKAKPVRYNSVPTRFVSLDPFMGGAQGKDMVSGFNPMPFEVSNNLEQKFNSGVNRTDMPSAWGYPNVTRKLARDKFLLANDIQAWRRNKGEPL